MFLKMLEVTETELTENQLPHIKRGQWVKIPTGARGQYVGYNHYTGVVRIAWLNGRKLKQQNAFMRLACQSFDTQMTERNRLKVA